jgi:hypothetical protein
MTTRGKQRVTVKKGRFNQDFTGKAARTILYNPVPSVPDEFDTYMKTFFTLNSAGATASISQKIFTNSLLHTSDDGLGAGSVFLSKFGAMYSKYRVVTYTVQYTISSRNTGDCNLVMYHTGLDPAFSSGSSWLPESATRDKSYYFLVPANTKSPCVIHSSQKFGLAHVVGRSEYLTDDNYVGTISAAGAATDPADLTYLIYYTGNVSGSAFTASTSPQVSLTLTQCVKFYDKRA